MDPTLCVCVCAGNEAFFSEMKPCLISVPERQTDQAGTADQEQTGRDEEGEM